MTLIKQVRNHVLGELFQLFSCFSCGHEQFIWNLDTTAAVDYDKSIDDDDDN